MKPLLVLMHPQAQGWITWNTNRLATCPWSVLRLCQQWQKKPLKVDYSTKHEEGDTVSGLTTLSCGNAPRQRWMSTSKAGGREGLPRHRAGRGKRRWTHTPQPPHLQCPAVSAAVRQRKPVPARNGISFQYKKKPIHTKKYTVYLNQQSNIHWDVLHANAWRHSTTKNIFTYTRIKATQYLNAKSTKWLLHLLFLTNKTLCWEKVNEVTAENTAQQDKTIAVPAGRDVVLV